MEGKVAGMNRHAVVIFIIIIDTVMSIPFKTTDQFFMIL